MKKRFLALALCLVLATSLLPITAAANEPFFVTSVTINASGVEERNGYYYVKDSDWKVKSLDGDEINDQTSGVDLFTEPIFKNYPLSGRLTDSPEEGTTYYYRFYLVNINGGNQIPLLLAPEYTVTLNIDGFQTNRLKIYDYYGELGIDFALTKDHDWRFTVSESGDKLTAECKNNDTPPVTLSLSAHSVTLPDSPFNARLEGEKEFQTAFPNAAISKIRYDYKDSDGVWHQDVNPVAANAKAGTYQAFVQVSNLPRPVESDGVVAMAENPDGTYTADLYVQYTAVDPAITAQTGDNRPIELMFGGLVVFAALAAAAFALDNKRKYSR